MGPEAADSRQPRPQFSHTHNSVYLVGFFAVACIFYDSTQGILQRYELNRKWFYLYGATCLFAYLYIRPLIRRGLGSASSGYINFNSVYIGWLCSAVFLHLPSMASMGIDIKTDVSLLLTIFLLSLLVLLVLHMAHGAAVALKLMSPTLYNPFAVNKELYSIILLNSWNIAIACSTYYAFCGNATEAMEASPGGFKAAVCRKWLHPINMEDHANFAPWVIYGGGAASSGNATMSNASSILKIDIPLDGRGPIAIPAGQTISPVFTMWCTLALMYLANCLSDYGAAAVLKAPCVAELHRRLRDSRASRRSGVTSRSMSRRSLDASGLRRPGDPPLSWRRSLDRQPSYLNASSLGRGPNSMSAASMRSYILGSARESMDPLTPMSRRSGVTPSFPWTTDPWASYYAALPARSYAKGEDDEDGEERPDFVPMFPWYSGTSADMFRTVFDLVVSLKLFLGRFDMRTMQAATAPDRGRGPPREGDGFTFEHLAARDHAWLDFCADTGDGGDPTYSVARAMAAPSLQVVVPPELPTVPPVNPNSPSRPRTAVGADDSDDGDASSGLDTPPKGELRGPSDGKTPFASTPRAEGTRVLPRADALILGGDLAYPNPSNETYETRFFRPFEAALPPPPHVHPGLLVVHKPDLPPLSDSRKPTACACTPCACSTHADQSAGTHTGRSDCRPCAAAEALRRFDGPTCFAIPGNHDWIDGLETFQRHIQHKGWLGGWLLPQEKSYFALRLPQGWWLFGLDLALVDDIDMCQCRYFARIADERMGPEDCAILVTHQPRWLMDWFFEEAACHNLRQLVRQHLRGRARVHLAGDLHFYMRHSFQPAPQPQPPPPEHVSSKRQSNGFDIAAPISESTMSCRSSADLSSLASSDEEARMRDIRELVDELARAGDDGDDAGGAVAPVGPCANLHPHDPEHLIVNGLGGAFLHPTHVFAPARFISVPEPPDDAAFLRGATPRGRSRGASPSGRSPRGQSPKGGASPCGTSPARAKLTRRGSFIGDVGVGKLEDSGAAGAGGGGEFRCTAAYPSPAKSLELGRQNLHLFRLKNTRFDVVGGAMYFLLVVSVLPRCHGVAEILDAHTLWEGLTALLRVTGSAAVAIFAESYLSLAALLLLFVLTLVLARSGGVGALGTASAPPPAAAKMTLWETLALRGRAGGIATQLLCAGLHTGAHLLAALLLLTLLELGVETCIRYESVGAEGYHSLFRWYQRFEAEQFPDPYGLRENISGWTLGLYPGIVKYVMAIFDLPEAIAVARTHSCQAGKGLSGLTRLEAAGYYGGMLAYYWLLATPVWGLLFGCYLYTAVNVFHVHYDEAFSALRIPDFKGFSRLHITPSGDLHIYGLAMDKVPCEWREDPRWRGPKGGGDRRLPAHRAAFPSRWLPVLHLAGGTADGSAADDSRVKIIDYLVVPKARAHH